MPNPQWPIPQANILDNVDVLENKTRWIKYAYDKYIKNLIEKGEKAKIPIKPNKKGMISSFIFINLEKQ